MNAAREFIRALLLEFLLESAITVLSNNMEHDNLRIVLLKLHFLQKNVFFFVKSRALAK